MKSKPSVQVKKADIEYAMNECFHFMSNPKKSHGLAVKQIGRYLLATKKMGSIVLPIPTSCSRDIFVDASFAGEGIKGEQI